MNGATTRMATLIAALICAAAGSASGQSQGAPPTASTSVETCDLTEVDKSEILGVVIFPELSDNLQASDKRILTALLASAKAAGYTKLLLVGFADQGGSVALNLRLGGRRADAVRQYLTADAVSLTLRIMTCGEDRPILPTGGGGHPHNRRVEVRGLR